MAKITKRLVDAIRPKTRETAKDAEHGHSTVAAAEHKPSRKADVVPGTMS